MLAMGTAATPEQQSAAAALGSEKWVELVSFTPLGAGYLETHRNFFRVNHPHRITHLRVNMFPDGGIMRVRAIGQAVEPMPPEEASTSQV